MKTFIFALVLLSLNVWSQDKYFGAKSTEAMLKFNSSIEIETQRSVTTEQLNGATPKAREIQETVDNQLSFLIGHFQSESFQASYKFPGVLGDNYKVKFTSVGPRVGSKQIVYYHFKGKVVFHTNAFTKADTVEVPLRLPQNPYTLYSKGIVKGKNKCTDAHYDSEEDLFYFWDPDKNGCPLKDNSTDVLRITGELERLPNTLSTYPEYDRLYSQEDLNISVFLGYIEDEPRSSRTKDDGYKTYKELSEELIGNGYTIVEQDNFKTINYITKLEKNVRNQLGIKQKVRVTLLLSDSSVETSDQTFTRYFSEALRNSQIVAYDGHSGLGGNLGINRFDIAKLPSFYQIYFFNGCSSYPYFNSIYFDQKPGGKKNLEIITAGLPTLTSTSTANMLAFLNPFISGKIHSYQSIMNSLERSNAGEGTYLMGVNGDEDNKFKPEGRPKPSLLENF